MRPEIERHADVAAFRDDDIHEIACHRVHVEQFVERMRERWLSQVL